MEVKTFVERLEAVTTQDRQLDTELTAELYLEDLLSSWGRKIENYKSMEVLWSTEHPKDVAGARGEHENRASYDDWRGSWRIWLEKPDGTWEKYHPPGFTWNWEFVRGLLEQEGRWTARYDGTLAERRYVVTINDQPPTAHVSLVLAGALAWLKYQTTQPEVTDVKETPDSTVF